MRRGARPPEADAEGDGRDVPRSKSPDETTDSPPSPNPPSNERINLFPPIHPPTGIPSIPHSPSICSSPTTGSWSMDHPGAMGEDFTLISVPFPVDGCPSGDCQVRIANKSGLTN